MSNKTFLSVDSKDLCCPICYCDFGLKENIPMSINCGHPICSICFEKVSKCPLCKVRFHKRMQKHEKDFLLSSLIINKAKIKICKDHSEVCQAFCLQDKVFVCIECVMKNHQGHEIITIKEISQRADKARIALHKARKAKDTKHMELKNSLEAETKRQKRQLDEIIDQEISHLSMLKKKLYREADIRMTSEKERYEHQLLSENLSKYCKNTEKMLQDWNQSPEVDLAVHLLEEVSSEEIKKAHQKYEDQINQFKAEITKKHVQSMKKTLKSLNSLRLPSKKLKKLFTPNPTQYFPQVDLDYLTNVFQVYGFTASQKNGLFELKVHSPTVFIPKFEPSYFACSLTKISLNCLDITPSISFEVLCQILQNIQTLQDITLCLQKASKPDLSALTNLISNVKTLEKFKVQIDLNDIARSDASVLMKNLTSLQNLFSLDIQHNTPHTIISLQFRQSSPANLQEISLGLEGLPDVICGALNSLNSSEAKPLKTLRFSLGKTRCQTKILETVCETLRLQSDLEELVFTCEELSESSSCDLSSLLSTSTQKKKLGVLVDKVLTEENPTKFLPKDHQTLRDLEEFTLKLKYDRRFAIVEDFVGLIGFLSSLKSLKKLCLKFDGVESTFDCNHDLFFHLAKLKTLESLEIEYIDLYGQRRCDQRSLESILKGLPRSVAKKCVFSKSDFRYADWDYLSESSEYSDDADEEEVEES